MPGTLTLICDGSGVIGRRPGDAPFAFDEMSLVEVWDLLANERDDRSDLQAVVLFADGTTLDERRSEIDDLRQRVESVNVRELSYGTLPRLAATLLNAPGVNLLQGDYAARSNWTDLARPWRAAAMLVGALLAMSLLGTALEGWKLGREDEALGSEVSSICAASYSSPQESRCRLEMQRRLSGAGQSAASGSGTFLRMLASVAGASGESMQLEDIAYRDGVMTLQATIPSVGYLDSFGQGVSEAGNFNVITVSTAPKANAVETRLQIVEPAR